MSRLRGWSSAIGAVLLIGLVGCSAAQPASLSVPSPTKSANLSNLVLPLEAYQLSDAELARMDSEWAQLMTRCAATYGATLSYASDYTRDPNDKTLRWGGSFGTLSEKQASEFGYHAPPNGLFQPAAGFYLKNPDNIVLLGEGSPLDTLISYGRSSQKNDPSASIPLPIDTEGRELPPGGCMGAVRKQIGTSLVSDSDLRRDLTEAAFNDPRTQSAVADWSKCMRESGYSFKRPMDAPASVGILSPGELKLAVTDVGCTQSSNWAGVFYTLLIPYQEEAIAKNSQLVQSVLDSQKKVLERLDALVAQ